LPAWPGRALVRIDLELALDALVVEGGLDLLRLGQGHPGVVRAVDDEERRPHVVQVRDGRSLLEERAVVLEAAVLPLPVSAAIPRGVLEEGHE